MSIIPAFEIGIWNGWIFMLFFIFQQFLIRPINMDVYKKMDDPTDIKYSRTEKIARLITMPTMFAVVIYSIFLPLKLGTAWFYVGLSIYLIGSVVMIIALVNFYTTPVKNQVTKGIYHYSRHPMYFAFILWFLGVGIATASWIVLLFSAIWSIFLNILEGAEERSCINKYGSAYHEYMSITPKWIGIPRKVKK